jgi:acyl carrier protein
MRRLAAAGQDIGMQPLIEELKRKIIATLNLLDVSPEQIDPDAPLVGGPLGIDSIDVLELVMMLEKDYGVAVESREEGARILASLRSLAQHIQRPGGAGAQDGTAEGQRAGAAGAPAA